MLHLGDITKISGHTAPMVDCIIGGSPCQDLSVAGKREGLDGARSGLYIEQTRIVKEMRERDRHNGRTGVDIRPRYMVWENVPGAFSSNKGEDFRIVLEELAKIADENASVPMPPKGKWTTSGCIMGDGWSIAWRVLDAQFWGTSDKPLPQRRRRIALIADFGGESAPEILFVRQSESGDIKPGEQKRKESAADARGGTEADDCFGFDRYNQCSTGDVTETLRTPNGGDNYPCVCHSIGCDLYNTDITGDRSSTLGVNCGMSHGRQGVIEQALFQPVTYDGRGNGDGKTVNTITGDHNNRITDYSAVVIAPQTVYAVDQGGGKSSCDVREGQAPTLTCTHDGAPVIALDRASFNQGENAKYDFEISDKGVNSPLVARGPSAVCYEAVLMEAYQHHGYRESETCGALTAEQNGHVRGDTSLVCYWDGSQTAGTLTANNASGCQRMPDKENFNCVIQGINGDKAGTLDSSYYKGCGERSGVEREVVAMAVDARNATEDEVNGALQSNAAHSLNGNNVVRHRYIVRRLTPLECERLQGYPDGWTDIGEWVDSNGKKRQTSDAARYKALGNSIALPPWKWVLKRLCACYERDATMASLFDGIGGFPLIWEQLNGKGSCLWASEIEEFPMAVTKVRIGE